MQSLHAGSSRWPGSVPMPPAWWRVLVVVPQQLVGLVIYDNLAEAADALVKSL